MLLSRILLFSAISIGSASASHHQQRETSDNAFTWKTCNVTGGVQPTQCGSLMVPLDYTDDSSNDRLRLDLQRVEAVKKPKQGSILLNFGGPGADGRGDLGLLGPWIQAATGGSFDLINVVPRGTNDTLFFQCYPAEDRAARALGLEVIAGNSSNVAVGEGWRKAAIFDANCAATQNKTGDLIGTAFLARDLMQVVDALDEDGMLRYWGVSYGSLLGATVASMFPKRMDKVILDGVVNPFEYYQNVETELFEDTDAVFRGFCKACVKNPENCTLANGQSAQELEDTIVSFFDSLKKDPIPLIDPTNPVGGQVVDNSIMKLVMWRGLYTPHAWPGVANILAAGIARNLTGLAASFDAVRPTEPQFGIKCSDVVAPNSKLEDALPIFEERLKRSRIFGDVAHQIVGLCSQWKMPAKERHKVPRNVKTKNPMLLIGNTFDPITPLASAKNVSAAFEGSVVLQQDGYGHDSQIQASLCTGKAIRSYFVNGTLPKEGTVCDVKVPLFSGSTGWEDVIPQLVGAS